MRPPGQQVSGLERVEQARRQDLQAGCFAQGRVVVQAALVDLGKFEFQ